MLRRIRSGFDHQVLTFGDHYPPPPMTVSGLPPRTARRIDRTQLIALEAVAALQERCGQLWSDHTATTGVLVGMWEPLRQSLGATVRSYAPNLSRLASALREAGHPASGDAVAEGLAQVLQQVPPLTGDVTPGLMANVTAARIASRWDLHGLTLAVGAGRDAVLQAVEIADRFLSAGQLDVALVIGANGNSTPLAAALTGIKADSIAEGAFVFALTRASLARERGTPALARIGCASAALSVEDPRDITLTGGASPQRPSFLSADGALGILRALMTPEKPSRVHGQADRQVLNILPVELPATFEGRPRPRCQLVYAPATGHPQSAPLDPLPRGSLVLTNRPELAARLVNLADSADTTIVCTGSNDGPGTSAVATPVGDWDNLEAARVELRRPLRDVRVVADLGGPTDEPPADHVRRLHELAFLAASRVRAGGGENGTFLTVMLGGVRNGTPVPAAGLFTGMNAGLALDLPTVRFVTLATDAADLETALAQLRRESAHASTPHGVCVVQGQRHAVRLIEAAATAPVPGHARPSVILAVGGGRGITAACVRALVTRSSATLWILGSTPLDGWPQHLLTCEDEAFRALTPEILRQAVHSEPGRTLAEARRRLGRLRAARETARTLAGLRDINGPQNTHYVPCDIRDRSAVAEAARQVLAVTPEIDLLINGAGVRHSAAPGHKPLTGFRDVIQTKIDGHHNLKTAFRGQVRQWCTFGSVISPLGLQGEADYGAAGAYLENTARLSFQSKENEFTIVWPLWGEIGMAADPRVQAAVTRHVRLAPLDPDEGSEQFLAELDAQTSTPTPTPLPLRLDDVQVLREDFPSLF
ncbi:SDR family NAD(P)-dependent oxidoreductase [Streptomyces poriticola]|uniref:SDR family NAD(P)-dependent oxidoreductase n=1 Tax=Streptomyces poriticola TaxID=3120506 RepID=UPI002FCE4F01